MLRNYLTIAFRTLLKSKTHTAINVFGLTLGIACCLLITLFVRDEWTFDRFHSKADRIYRVYVKENWGENQEFFNTVTPFPLGPALKNNFEEVEKMTRITATSAQVHIGSDRYQQTVFITGQDFFDMFDFNVIAGDRSTALTAIDHVVLTKELAERYFGKEDPINKIVRIQFGESLEDFTVRAIVENIPTNSSIRFGVLISDLNFPKRYSEQALISGWFNITPETYVLLREGVRPHELEAKFPAMLRSQLGEETYKKSNFEAGLQPLTSIHLDTSYPAGMAPVSNPRYAYILAAVAVLLLVVACINFITLSIGRSIRRAKEVGIRKVAGAARRQLIAQFVSEAVIVTSISLILGFASAQLAMPVFNAMAGKELALTIDSFTILTALVLIIIIGLLAGSYPAFILSGFRPVTILKGSVQGLSNRQGLRKALVGVQLVLSIFLISSTLIMQDQLRFLQNKNLGFDKEQLVIVPLNIRTTGKLPERIAKGFNTVEQFKSALGKLPDVKGVCGASHDFADGDWTNVGYTDDNGVYRTFFMNVIEPDYIPVMNIEMAGGRNFSHQQPSDARSAVIINQAFAREMGWSDPIGKRIPGKNFPDHEIIGVVHDFNFASLYTSVKPLAMVMDAGILLKGSENVNMDNSPIPKLFVRLHSGNMSVTIDRIKEHWSKITGGDEFVFWFLDDALNRQYRSDQNLGKIIRYATALAVIIEV